MEEAKLNLTELSKSLRAHLDKTIQENISYAVENSTEWSLLKEVCPSLKELTFYVSTSGFNDGDPEYDVARPLFFYNYSSNFEDGYRKGGEYEEDVFGEETEEDIRVFGLVSQMKNQKTFMERYERAVRAVFDSIGKYYPHLTVIRIKVGGENES